MLVDEQRQTDGRYQTSSRAHDQTLATPAPGREKFKDTSEIQLALQMSPRREYLPRMPVRELRDTELAPETIREFIPVPAGYHHGLRIGLLMPATAENHTV